MKKFIIFILIILCQQVLFSQTLQQKLNEYFDEAEKTGIFNGSVMIVKGSDTLLRKGFGFKNFENNLLQQRS
jgi:hypothetical protein